MQCITEHMEMYSRELISCRSRSVFISRSLCSTDHSVVQPTCCIAITDLHQTLRRNLQYKHVRSTTKYCMDYYVKYEIQPGPVFCCFIT